MSKEKALSDFCVDSAKSSTIRVSNTVVKIIFAEVYILFVVGEFIGVTDNKIFALDEGFGKFCDADLLTFFIFRRVHRDKQKLCSVPTINKLTSQTLALDTIAVFKNPEKIGNGDFKLKATWVIDADIGLAWVVMIAITANLFIQDKTCCWFINKFLWIDIFVTPVLPARFFAKLTFFIIIDYIGKFTGEGILAVYLTV